MSSRSVFTISILVILLTIMGVFFWSLGHHTTFFESSILSTTILSAAFFLFIGIGLYRGVKLKDDVGTIGGGKASFQVGMNLKNPTHYVDSGPDFDVSDGLMGAVLGFVLWIVCGIIMAVAVWLFANVFLLVIAAFATMLYWIFFRAMRLVFRHSAMTKGRIWKSIQYGVLYTFLYNFWIYGIFIVAEYLKRG